LLGLVVVGGDWRLMILTEDVFVSHQIDTYGYPMWIVYAIWIFVVLLLYPISRKYMIYKAMHKDKWWLSYS
jgi:hypothetical protein